jgi:two-component system, cell cycle sensor histidine kinase and response regulator CckA
MRDYRLSELLDLSIIQKLADSNFSTGGLSICIIDTIDASILVRAGWQEECSVLHSSFPYASELCSGSDVSPNGFHGKGEFYSYSCKNGLQFFVTPIIVAGRHLATMFLTEFSCDGEVPGREYCIRMECECGKEPARCFETIDGLSVFSAEKVNSILEYQLVLVQLITDLAEKSLQAIEDAAGRNMLQEVQQKAIEDLEMQVRARIADLENANELLHIEIAERRRVEEKLREHYQFLEVLINAIPSPVFYKDANGIYQGCNKAFEQYLGLAREQIIGKTDYDLATKEVADKYHVMDQAIIAKPGIQDYETSISDAANVRHEVIIIKAAYYNSEGTVGGIICIMVDVSDRRKFEEERLKMDKLESLGVLAGGIAHDFNNIITGILGNISLARIYIDESHKSYKPLGAAEKASQRATELAHQLLTFSKGGAPIKKRITLQHIVNECVSFILRGSNVQGVVDISDSLHAVEADEGQISQAFGNIILNGVQSMPGGGTLKIHGENVTLENKNRLALPPGKYVKIDFMDKGCGIDVETRKKIFDPYFTTKAKGTGLGLSSAYSIILRHGGCIDVQSAVDMGTIFTCYLPSTGEILLDQPTKPERMNISDPVGELILVMDDEEMIRDIAAEILDYLGYHATTCSRGEEAVALYKAAIDSGTPFFAAIMDLTIPGGMGGKEAAEQILALDPHARLIVSSGYSVDPVMANYKRYGFCGAVEKPYETKEIAQVLGSIANIHPCHNLC